MVAPRTLFRFPGPLPLGRLLDGEPPTLHHPEAAVAYLGDLALWSWPGVAEFGALTIFDADRLGPRPAAVDGWFVVDVAPLDPQTVLYVPDRRCAVAVVGAADAEHARGRLPDHHREARREARRAIARYDDVSRRVAEALGTLGDADDTGQRPDPLPARWQAYARTPLHMLSPARREALAAALERAAARPRSP